jgi:hypothetical protein
VGTVAATAGFATTVVGGVDGVATVDDAEAPD